MIADPNAVSQNAFRPCRSYVRRMQPAAEPPALFIGSGHVGSSGSDSDPEVPSEYLEHSPAAHSHSRVHRARLLLCRTHSRTPSVNPTTTKRGPPNRSAFTTSLTPQALRAGSNPRCLSPHPSLSRRPTAAPRPRHHRPPRRRHPHTLTRLPPFSRRVLPTATRCRPRSPAIRSTARLPDHPGRRLSPQTLLPASWRFPKPRQRLNPRPHRPQSPRRPRRRSPPPRKEILCGTA